VLISQTSKQLKIIVLLLPTRETPIVLASGTLKPGIDKEVPNKQKKWASPGSAQGNAVYIPNR